MYSLNDLISGHILAATLGNHFTFHFLSQTHISCLRCSFYFFHLLINRLLHLVHLVDSDVGVLVLTNFVLALFVLSIIIGVVKLWLFLNYTLSNVIIFKLIIIPGIWSVLEHTIEVVGGSAWSTKHHEFGWLILSAVVLTWI